MALPDILAVEDLFGPPERAGASISPDGTRIAYLAPWKNRLNVWVRSLGADGDARCVTADETRSVLHHSWADDPRWLIYLQDDGGDENWHLFRVDLDDPDAQAVDNGPLSRRRTSRMPQIVPWGRRVLWPFIPHRSGMGITIRLI